MTADPIEAEEDLESLLQQAANEPLYAAADVALIEERLARFDVLVRAAYHRIEELPLSAKQRKARRRNLVRARKEIRNAVRFALRFGTPAELDLARLNQMELEILAAFPDAEPRITRN
jgi:hypothetical protein